MKQLKFILTLMILGMLAIAVEAADRFASTTGSGTTCSIGSPCTLTQAVSGASIGDNIYIRGGTYTGTIDVSALTGGSISVQTWIGKYQSEVVVVQPTSGNACIEGAYEAPTVGWITFDGIICDNINADGGGMAIWQSHHITFQNGEVKNTNQTGFLIDADDISILNTSFHSFISDCVPGNRWYGIYVAGANSNVTITGNTFTSNPGGAIQVWPGSSSGIKISRNTFTDNNTCSTSGNAAVLIGSSDAPIVDSNIFNGNGLSGGGVSRAIDLNTGVIGAKIFSNTIYNHTHAGVKTDAGVNDTEVRNNIIYLSNGIQDDGTGTIQSNNLTTNPIFVNIGTGDFHLQSSSPARNAGAALGSPYDVDYDGVGRGPVWDIGAFQFSTGGSDPNISINSPTTNSNYAVATSTVALSGSASDDVAVTSVDWSGSTCGSGTATGTTSWSIATINLSLGPCIITVTAHDAAGNSSGDSITVIRVNPQLVLAMAMDENTGASVADTSGNSNNGTIANATWTTAGRFGNALVFDGTGDVVTVADSASLDVLMFTQMAWVFPTQVNTDFRAVMVKSYVYYLYATVAGLCGDGGIVGGFNDALGCYAPPLSINAWSHLAVTYDTLNIKIYLNGVLVSTTPAGGLVAQSAGALTIGLSEFGEGFIGRIDEPRIYNYDIGATQIALDMVTPITVIAVSPAIKFGVGSAILKCGAVAACLKLSR